MPIVGTQSNLSFLIVIKVSISSLFRNGLKLNTIALCQTCNEEVIYSQKIPKTFNEDSLTLSSLSKQKDLKFNLLVKGT